MAQLLTCRHGHRWELQNREPASIPSSRVVCPVCGDTAEALPLEQAGNGSQEAATLPPNPVPAGGAEAETLPPPEQASAPATQQRAGIPGYEIVGELGRGGMGVVYKARQVQLNRLVALKMILAGSHAGAADLARFRTEGEAVARLQHPNIVQIHEVGEADGRPFFSLEFCPGGSLDSQLDGTPLPPRKAAQLVETLALAMHAAHQAGIVHRDLKPANVLLDADGTPKVTDFGLAKRLESEPGVSKGEPGVSKGEPGVSTPGGLTVSGAIMGTPSYMAPEQAGGSFSRDPQGSAGRIGPAADIYALGAILYECLTGRPPFKAATPLDTIMQVVADEPVPPTQLNAKVPRDLETICLKCLAKEPARRYGTAVALAEDLGRFQAGLPVQARPVGKLERGWRWCRRNPVLAGLTAAVAVLLVIVSVVSTLMASRLTVAGRQLARTNADLIVARDDARQNAEESQRARVRADKQRDETRRRLYAAQLNLASEAAAAGQTGLLLELLQAQLPQPGQTDFRGFEWYHLWHLCHREKRTVSGIEVAAISPDGRILAGCSDSQGLRLWDLGTGKELRALVGHKNHVRCLAFAANGKTLASGSDDGELRLWEVFSGKPQATLTGHKGLVVCLSFSPDGARLASGGKDRLVRLWNVKKGRLEAALPGHQGAILGLSFAPNGKTLCSRCNRGVVKLWHLKDGGATEKTSFYRGDAWATTTAFSADGKSLAIAWCVVGRLFSVMSAPILALEDIDEASVDLVHKSLEQGSMDVLSAGEVVDYAVESGEKRATRSGFRGWIYCLGFSADGKILAAGTADVSQDYSASWTKFTRVPNQVGHLYLWDASSQRELLAAPQPGGIRSLVFAPDGKTLALGVGPFGEVKVCRIAPEKDKMSLEVTHRLLGHTGPVSALRFVRGGRGLATISVDDGTQRLWGVDALGEPLLLGELLAPGLKGTLAYSPDGKTLATGGGPTAKVWDLTNGSSRVFSGFLESVGAVGFSPDGKTLAFGSYRLFGAHVVLWDTAARKVRRTLTAGSILTVNQQQGLDFSPDGKWLATLDDKVIKWEERGVTIWDIESGKTVATLPCPTKPRQSSRAVAFSPDGKLLAVGHSQGRVDLWNTATWQHAGGWALPGRTDDFAAIRFTADGKRLVVLTSKKPSWSYFQGEAGLWDVAGRTELANLKGHRGPVTGVAVSPDGKTLATTSVDRTIKLWDGKSGQYLATLVDRQEVAVAVAFSHDGTQLAALGMDGIIRIWHAPRTAEH